MKFPRTMHLTWSPGLQNDDRVTEHFHLWSPGEEVVVTEKLDGESANFLTHKMHARSEDSLHHESRNFAKARWGVIKHLIPLEMQFTFENVYAKHSIYYPELTDFVYLLSAFDFNLNLVLSYDELILWSQELNVELAPVLYRGPLEDWNPTLPEKSAFGPDIEGYVIRKTREFPIDEYHIHVAKYVRKGHVQTDAHWLRTWTPNKLKEK